MVGDFIGPETPSYREHIRSWSVKIMRHKQDYKYHEEDISPSRGTLCSLRGNLQVERVVGVVVTIITLILKKQRILWAQALVRRICIPSLLQS